MNPAQKDTASDLLREMIKMLEQGEASVWPGCDWAARAVAITQAPLSGIQQYRTGYGEGVRAAAKLAEEYGAHLAAETIRNLQSKAPTSITQAATSEPVAPYMYLMRHARGYWVEISKELYDKEFDVSTCAAYAAPVAHLAGTTPNTEAPSDEKAEFEKSAAYQGNADLTPAPEMLCENGWFPATYRSAATELAWRCYANKRAALSAQQAGVQEAPSEDASYYKTQRDGMLEFIKNAQVSSGVCCCGDDMARHGNPMDSGHNPVDMWDHSVLCWDEQITKQDQARAALAAATQTEKP